jgi:DNA-binding transcriptional LysR family regulator
MRGLEEANGVVLLSREPRGVSPTAAGSVLARHARLMFDQVQRLERDLVHVREAPERPLVLLANSSALSRPLAAALAELPYAPVLVRESPSEATVRAIRSGAAGVGIVSDAVDTRGLVSHDLGPDPLVLVLARGHAFARRQSVHFKEALQLPWIAWGERSALSTHLLMHAAAFDAPLQPRITYPGVGGVLQLVARGLGVTVLPEALLHQHGLVHEIACVHLDDRWAQRRLLACHSVDADPMLHQFAERMVRHFSSRTDLMNG